jgi:6-pyruvoyltetrahydropterin/6-carboxytetrahydropterin synthase
MKLHTEIKIDAAHNLPNYDGKCHNLHGHTWRIVVEIDCDTLDKNDFVADFTKIKEVVNQFDHAYINDTIKNPTAENMVVYLTEEIIELGKIEEAKYFSEATRILQLNRFKSVTVKVYEAENSYLEHTIKVWDRNGTTLER